MRWACCAHLIHTGCKCTCGDRKGRAGDPRAGSLVLPGKTSGATVGLKAKVPSPYSPVYL